MLLQTFIEYLLCACRLLAAGIQWGIALDVSAHQRASNLTQLAPQGRKCVCVHPILWYPLSTQGPGTESWPGDAAGEIDLGSLISIGLPTMKAPKHITRHCLTVLFS